MTHIGGKICQPLVLLLDTFMGSVSFAQFDIVRTRETNEGLRSRELRLHELRHRYLQTVQGE